jgi:hypothetical protein
MRATAKHFCPYRLDGILFRQGDTIRHSQHLASVNEGWNACILFVSLIVVVRYLRKFKLRQKISAGKAGVLAVQSGRARSPTRPVVGWVGSPRRSQVHAATDQARLTPEIPLIQSLAPVFLISGVVSDHRFISATVVVGAVTATPGEVFLRLARQSIPSKKDVAQVIGCIKGKGAIHPAPTYGANRHSAAFGNEHQVIFAFPFAVISALLLVHRWNSIVRALWPLTNGSIIDEWPETTCGNVKTSTA